MSEIERQAMLEEIRRRNAAFRQSVMDEEAARMAGMDGSEPGQPRLLDPSLTTTPTIPSQEKASQDEAPPENPFREWMTPTNKGLMKGLSEGSKALGYGSAEAADQLTGLARDTWQAITGDSDEQWQEIQAFRSVMNEPDTEVGKMLASITQFAMPFGAGAKLMKGANQLTRTAKAGGWGFLVEGAVFDPYGVRLAHMLDKVPVLEKVVPDWLASDNPEDSVWEQRLKVATEGTMLGAIGEGLFQVLRHGVLRYKAGRPETAITGPAKMDAEVAAAMEAAQAQAAAEEVFDPLTGEAIQFSLPPGIVPVDDPKWTKDPWKPLKRPDWLKASTWFKEPEVPKGEAWKEQAAAELKSEAKGRKTTSENLATTSPRTEGESIERLMASRHPNLTPEQLKVLTKERDVILGMLREPKLQEALLKTQIPKDRITDALIASAYEMKGSYQSINLIQGVRELSDTGFLSPINVRDIMLALHRRMSQEGGTIAKGATKHTADIAELYGAADRALGLLTTGPDDPFRLADVFDSMRELNSKWFTHKEGASPISEVFKSEPKEYFIISKESTSQVRRLEPPTLGRYPGDAYWARNRAERWPDKPVDPLMSTGIRSNSSPDLPTHILFDDLESLADIETMISRLEPEASPSPREIGEVAVPQGVDEGALAPGLVHSLRGLARAKGLKTDPDELMKQVEELRTNLKDADQAALRDSDQTAGQMGDEPDLRPDPDDPGEAAASDVTDILGDEPDLRPDPDDPGEAAKSDVTDILGDEPDAEILPEQVHPWDDVTWQEDEQGIWRAVEESKAVPPENRQTAEMADYAQAAAYEDAKRAVLAQLDADDEAALKALGLTREQYEEHRREIAGQSFRRLFGETIAVTNPDELKLPYQRVMPEMLGMALMSAQSVQRLARMAGGSVSSEAARAAFLKSVYKNEAILYKLVGDEERANMALARTRMKNERLISQHSGNAHIQAFAAAVDNADTLDEGMRLMREWRRPDRLPGIGQTIQHVRLSSMLSGPSTHLKNIAGNMIPPLLDIPEQFIASSFIHGGPHKRETLEDTTARIYGQYMGWKLGMKMAASDFRIRQGSAGGASVIEAQLAEEGLDHIRRDFARLTKTEKPWITGEDGIARQFNAASRWTSHPIRRYLTETRWTNMPFDLLQTGDMFFKSISFMSEAHVQAVQQLRRENPSLKGLDLREAAVKRVGELSQDDTIYQKALTHGELNTFTGELGEIGQAIVNSLNWGGQAGRFVIPFPKTMMNIFKYAVRGTPASPLIREVRENLSQGGEARAREVARMTTGMMIIAGMAPLVHRGLVTGSGGDNSWKQTPYPKNAFRFADDQDWHMYQHLPRVGFSLGVMADVTEMLAAAETEEEFNVAQAAFALGAAMIGRAMDETWAGDAVDFGDALMSASRGNANGIISFAARQPGSMVPFAGLRRDAQRIWDYGARENVRVGGGAGPGEEGLGEAAHEIWQTIYKQSFPLLRALSSQAERFPARNLYGQVMTSAVAPDALIDGKIVSFPKIYMANLGLNAYIASADDPLSKELTRMRLGFPPERRGRVFTKLDRSRMKEYTPEQYDFLTKRTGEHFYRLGTNLVSFRTYGASADSFRASKLRAARRQARKRAISEMNARWPEFIVEEQKFHRQVVLESLEGEQ